MQSRSRLRPVGQQIAQLFDERTQAELNHVGGLEAPDRFQTAIRPKWLAQSSLSPTAPLATGNGRPYGPLQAKSRWEERRVGTECVSRCRSWGSPEYSKITHKTPQTYIQTKTT